MNAFNKTAVRLAAASGLFGLALAPLQAQTAAPVQGYAVIGGETIPIPLLSDGADRTMVNQSGQSNSVTLETQGRGVSTTQTQIGSGNRAGVSVAADQTTFTLMQSGNLNTANVSAVNGSGNRLGIEQVGNGNTSSISATGQSNTIVSQQIGSNLSNTISDVGSNRTITVRQVR
ncbi:hypothetical protein FV222_02515 [Methylobacterium sp. WL103]|nr:hypothetical protein [Methylobacterium sp. WL120]TXM64372.1 hypothetical protein FV229_18840 [Methylobacterium sp. WL120]TXN07393.1 hypothetical protein FV222_02515 [Methylobacterium sp. WL103]